MTQKEFLDTLYEQLSDQIPDAKASAHTQYYQEYIRNEIRNGKNEQDVLHSLGDPRLIAKTLIDTGAEPDSRFESSQEEVYHSDQSKHRRYRQDVLHSLGDPRLIAKTLIDTGAEPDSRFESSQEEVYHSDQSKHRRYRLDLSTWYGKLIVILAAAAVLILLFLAISFMLPVILIAGAVLFLISWFTFSGNQFYASGNSDSRSCTFSHIMVQKKEIALCPFRQIINLLLSCSCISRYLSFYMKKFPEVLCCEDLFWSSLIYNLSFIHKYNPVTVK